MISALKTQYDKLGAAIDKAKSKQTALTTAMAKSNALKVERRALLGEAMGTVAAAVGQAVIIRKSVNDAATYQDMLRDIRITGGFTENEENRLGTTVEGARYTNQTTSDLGLGVKQLVDGRRTLDEITQWAPLLGASATVFRTSMEQSANTFLALGDMGAKSKDDMQQAMDRLVWAARQGDYGFDKMFTTIGELGEQIKTSKLGLNSLNDITASLQVGSAKMGAESAKTGLQSWMRDMGGKRLAAAFENVGVDYNKSMALAVGKGLSEFEASQRIAMAYLNDTMGKKGLKELQATAGNSDAQMALLQRFGASDVFKDPNQANLVLSRMQSPKEYERLRAGGSAEAKDGFQRAFDLRITSPTERFKQLGLSLKALSITFGKTLMPSILALTDKLIPIVGKVTEWIASNPALVKGLVGVAVAITGIKLATIGFKLGKLFLVQTPINMASKALAIFGVKMELFKARTLLASIALKSSTGLFGLLKGNILGIGKVITAVGRTLLMSPLGLIGLLIGGAALLIYKYWSPIKAFLSGVFDGISEALAPVGEAFNTVFGPLGDWISKLLQPFEDTTEQLAGAISAGRTLGTVLGQAINVILTPMRLLFKTIEWLASGIKTVFSWSPLETISQIWSGVVGFFSQIWRNITTAFDCGILEVSQLIINWSPVGLFYKAFSAVLDWFGVELPDDLTGAIRGIIDNISNLFTEWDPLSAFSTAFQSVLSWFGIDLPQSFTDAGNNLMEGVVSGIQNKMEAVKDAITNVGSSVKGWFKDLLDIHSPSRVFMTLGGFISEGAALGIESKTGLVKKSMLGMAAATAISLPPPVLANSPQWDIPSTQTAIRQLSLQGGATNAPQFVYSPTIVIKGNDSDVRQQIQQGLQGGYNEFKRMIKRYEQEQQRRAYRGINT